MKVLTSWLKDFVKFDLATDKLVEKLNITGTEVEAVEDAVDGNVVVAEIRDVKPHPNADRLRIATVFDGRQEISVVCGAPNIAAGQKVPLARVGAKLAGGIEIKKVNIRGIESEGMLCAPDELGLGEDHSGIMVLDGTYEIGKPLAEYVGDDSLIEVEITPNRGDCLSHLGIAREIAAFTGGIVNLPEVELDHSDAEQSISVSVLNHEACPQYLALAMSDIKIGPSPQWLVDRLEKMGVHSINNVVDITNYVLFDLGQPLHAFDAGKIEKNQILVRSAEEGEKISVLDGTSRVLSPDDLVIADHDKPIAIAGIIGGSNSEVDDKTTNIILESAVFDRKYIRRTAKRLGITTEASYRFERGIDAGNTEYALRKAASLIGQIAGGKVLGSIARIATGPEHRVMPINFAKINQLLGLSLSEIEINKFLISLGFKIEGDQCEIPSWRHDIDVWQDLAEEVGRLYGYNKIVPIAPEAEDLSRKSSYYCQELLKDILVEAGFSEVINYPFLSSEDIQTASLNSENLLEVANPIQVENKYLRAALLPGLLKTIAKNPIFDPVLVFEFGKVFNKESEEKHLVFAAAGKKAKDLIEKAIAAVTDKASVHKDVLQAAEVAQQDLLRYKIRKASVFYCELPFDRLSEEMNIPTDKLTIKAPERITTYRPVSKFPPVTRDLAFVVDTRVGSDQIIESIYKQSLLINRVELFDEFISDKLGVGKKSLAFHLYLEHLDRTLTDKEADEIIENIVSAISKEFNAVLRD